MCEEVPQPSSGYFIGAALSVAFRLFTAAPALPAECDRDRLGSRGAARGTPGPGSDAVQARQSVEGISEGRVQRRLGNIWNAWDVLLCFGAPRAHRVMLPVVGV